MHMDIFNDDAFSLISLTAAINNVDHVPGRSGELVFAGVGEGVGTLTVSFESKAESLTLIQTSPRGAPAPKEKQDKSNIRAVSIPQIKLEDTIGAHQVQGVRAFGTTDQLRGVQTVVATQMNKMTLRHDLTLEHHRLGALKGEIKDANGATLQNLFTLFGVTNSDGNAGPEDFGFDFADNESEIRLRCMDVVRFIQRSAKTIIPSTARVWAFCGDNFFDELISHPVVKDVYKNTTDQERRLGANYAFGVFEFGGIVWENYRGTDDNATVAIDDDEARIFLTGVPGLYAEYFAPADFMETVNTVGLPRYAKLAPDNRFNQFVELHTQQNPLPICLRPKTLVRAVVGQSE